MSGFLLRFVKRGNQFAIAGGHHLVNVSQGMVEARWPREEWKPNMAELECQKKMLKRRAIPLQMMDIQLDIICWMFLHYLWKRIIPKTRTSFFKIIMVKFESHFNNFGNICFFSLNSL